MRTVCVGIVLLSVTFEAFFQLLVYPKLSIHITAELPYSNEVKNAKYLTIRYSNSPVYKEFYPFVLAVARKFINTVLARSCYTNIRSMKLMEQSKTSP